MSSFIKKTVKLQDLGERLRVMREKLRLSPEDIRRVGKIQPKYLLALETGEVRDLPATVYVKGFLRTLAQIYHVPATPLLDQFVEEREIRDNTLPPLDLVPKSKLAIPKFVLSPKLITISGVAFFGILSLGYLYFQISSLARPPRIELAEPLAETVSTGLLTVSGKTERGASVYLNNAALVVDATGNFSEALSLGLGANTLTIRAVNKFGQETVLTKQIMYAEQEIAGASTAEVVLLVSIEKRATRLEVVADGAAVFAGELAQGEQKVFNAAQKISLTTYDAGATRVSLNGKPLGVLGKTGETIANIEFTK